MADLFDVIGRQRACRSFRADPVPDADLERILDAACCAPSAENRQPWVFVVVRDPATRAAIADITRRAWEGGGAAHARGRLSQPFFDDVDRAVRAGFGGAPAVVVVAADTTEVVPAALGASIFPAVQNLLLAANALGYGSALTTLTTALEADLRAAVGLPDHLKPMAVTPIGRPAAPLGPPRRAPVAAKTHRDRYGRPW